MGGRTDAAAGAGIGAGAGAEGAADIGAPQPVQNLSSGGTLAPHFEHFASAAGTAAGGGGLAGNTAGLRAGAGVCGATPTGEPHPVQNLSPGATAAPHLAHFALGSAAAAAGAGGGVGTGAGELVDEGSGAGAGTGLGKGGSAGAAGFAATGASGATGCPQTVQMAVPAGKADQHIGHLIEPAEATTGFSGALGGGGTTAAGGGAGATGCATIGAAAAAGGAATTGDPHPVQNFIPAGTPAPHFEHFKPEG